MKKLFEADRIASGRVFQELRSSHKYERRLVVGCWFLASGPLIYTLHRRISGFVNIAI